LLGWTQEEIGEAVGLERSGVSKIVNELNQFNLDTIKSDFYEKHKKPEEIAEYYHLDIPLLWAYYAQLSGMSSCLIH
jgi:transcriptional regulator with XRE-family HTH domain